MLFVGLRQDDEAELLRREFELEKLRTMVGPEYWPRIYSMLQRVRDQLKECAEERKQDSARKSDREAA